MPSRASKRTSRCVTGRPGWKFCGNHELDGVAVRALFEEMLAEIKAQYLYPYTDQFSGPPGGDAQTNAWANGAHVAANSDRTTTIGPMRSPSVREADNNRPIFHWGVR